MAQEYRDPFLSPPPPDGSEINADGFFSVVPDAPEQVVPSFSYTPDQALQRGAALVLAADNDDITPEQVQGELTGYGYSEAEAQLLRETNAAEQSLIIGAGSDPAIGEMTPEKLAVLQAEYSSAGANGMYASLYVQAGAGVAQWDNNPEHTVTFAKLKLRQIQEAQNREALVNAAILDTEPETILGTVANLAQFMIPIINSAQFGHVANQISQKEGVDKYSRYFLAGSSLDAIAQAYIEAPIEQKAQMFDLIVETVKEWSKIDGFGIGSRFGVQSKGGLNNFIVLEEIQRRIHQGDYTALGAMDVTENVLSALDWGATVLTSGGGGVGGVVIGGIRMPKKITALIRARNARKLLKERGGKGAVESARDRIAAARGTDVVTDVEAQVAAQDAARVPSNTGEVFAPDEYRGMGTQMEMDLPQRPADPTQGELQLGEPVAPKERTFQAQGKTFVEGEPQAGDQFIMDLEGGGRRPPPPPGGGSAPPPRQQRSYRPDGSDIPPGTQYGFYLEGGKNAKQSPRGDGVGVQQELPLDNPNVPEGGVQLELPFEPREPATPEQLDLFPAPKNEQLAFDFGIEVPQPPQGAKKLQDEGIVPPLDQFVIPPKVNVLQGGSQNGPYFVGAGSPEALGTVLSTGGRGAATGLGVAPQDVQSVLGPKSPGTLASNAPPLVRDMLERARARVDRVLQRLNPRSYLTDLERQDRVALMQNKAAEYSQSLGRMHVDKTQLEVNETLQHVDVTSRYGRTDGGFTTVAEAEHALENAGGAHKFGQVDIVARNPVDGSFAPLTEDFVKNSVTRHSKGDFYIQVKQRHFWDAEGLSGWGKKLTRAEIPILKWFTARHLVLDRDVTQAAFAAESNHAVLNSRLLGIAKPYFKLSDSSKEKVANAIREGDSSQVLFSENELRTKFLMNEAERDAYFAVRAFYDTVYQMNDFKVYKYLHNKGARSIVYTQGERVWQGYGRAIDTKPAVKEVYNVAANTSMKTDDAAKLVKDGSHQWVKLEKRHHDMVNARKGDGWDYAIVPKGTKFDPLPTHVTPYYPGYAARLYTDRFKVAMRTTRKVNGDSEAFPTELAMVPTEAAALRMIKDLKQAYRLETGKDAPEGFFSYKLRNELDRFEEPSSGSNGILDMFESRGDRLPGEGILEAPIENIEQAIYRTANSTAGFASHKEFIDALRARFIKQYRGLLSFGEKHGELTWKDVSATMARKVPKQTREAREAKEVYDFIEMYTANNILRSDELAKSQEWLATVLEDALDKPGLGPLKNGGIGKAVRAANVQEIAGSANFITMIAANVIPQLFQNSISWLHLASLNPFRTMTASHQAVPVLLGTLTEGTPFYKILRAGASKAAGWSEDDFDAIVKAYADSGIYNTFDMHSAFNSGVLDLPGLTKATRAGKLTVKAVKRAGFDLGEAINLGVTQLWVMKRVAEENGITLRQLTKNQDLLDQVVAETRDLSGAQTRLGALPIQKTDFRLAYQFGAYTTYMTMRMLRGSPYQRVGDRWKAAVGAMFLYGAANLPEGMRDKLFAELDLNEMFGDQAHKAALILEGGLSDLAYNALIDVFSDGEELAQGKSDLAISRRISPFNAFRLWEHMGHALTGQGVGGRTASVLTFLSGPSATTYSNWHNAMKATNAFFASEELEPAEKWRLSAKRAASLFASGNALFRLEVAKRTMMMHSIMTGEPTVDATFARQLGLLIGATSLEEINLRVAKKMYMDYQQKGGKSEAYIPDLVRETFNIARIYVSEYGPLFNPDMTINQKTYNLIEELVGAGASTLPDASARREFNKEMWKRMKMEGQPGGLLADIPDILGKAHGDVGRRMVTTLENAGIKLDPEYKAALMYKYGTPIEEPN